MNERIKELARIAQGNNPADYDKDDDVIILATKDVEKFAELIIKECVGIVENLSPGYQDYRNQIEDAFRSDCITEIKYHFGVEE